MIRGITLREMMSCLSSALEGQNPALSQHHARVAFITARLGVVLGIEGGDLEDLFIAGLVHDLGLVTSREGDQFSGHSECEESHSIVSAHYLKIVPILAAASRLVRFHHVQFQKLEQMNAQGVDVPKHASVLQAADTIAGWIRYSFPMLDQRQGVIARVREHSGTSLNPAVALAFECLAKSNAFWLQLLHATSSSVLDDVVMPETVLDPNDVEQLAWLFSVIVDSRSRFTATHTAGVAATAVALGTRLGWPAEAARRLHLAGLLHDLGKLVVSASLLNKPGRLDDGQMAYIQSHSFYTLRFLEGAPALAEIATWAADHHERLDGSGYPFGKCADDIPMGSRIIAVADVFTALAEDRPYRAGMERAEIQEHFSKHTKAGRYDRAVVDVLFAHYDFVDQSRLRGQLKQTMGLREHWAQVDDELRENATLVAGRAANEVVPTRMGAVERVQA